MLLYLFSCALELAENRAEDDGPTKYTNPNCHVHQVHIAAPWPEQHPRSRLSKETEHEIFERKMRK
jgi:hypothetical protein